MRQKQKVLKILFLGNGFVNRTWMYLGASLLSVLFLARLLFAEEDPIYDHTLYKHKMVRV